MRTLFLGLGVIGAGALLVLSRKSSAALPSSSGPPTATNPIRVDDEVAVPLSALPGLPNVVQGAGGAIVHVDHLVNGQITGPIVAFVGPGGTTDVPAPIGPVSVPSSAVSTRTAAPSDRVGRFAQIGDLVVVPAEMLPGLAVQDDFLRADEHFDTFTVRVDKIAPGDPAFGAVIAALGGDAGVVLQGVVVGDSRVGPNSSGGSLSANPSSVTAPTTPQFARGIVMKVMRGPQNITVASRTNRLPL